MRTATRRATVYGVRRADWWTVAGQTCVAAYQPIGAADLATSYVNLANPGTYNAAPGVAPGLAAGGWTFDGSTQYLTTGVVPASGWSILVRFANASGPGNHVPVGLSSSAGVFRFYLRPRSANTNRIYGYGNAANVVAGVLVSGIMAMAGNACYLDGVGDGTAGAWAAVDVPLFIGCENQKGSAPVQQYWFIGTIASIAIYSTTLSAGDVAAQTVKMQGLA